VLLILSPASGAAICHCDELVVNAALLMENHTGEAVSWRSSSVPSTVKANVPELEPVTVNDVLAPERQSRFTKRLVPRLLKVTRMGFMFAP